MSAPTELTQMTREHRRWLEYNFPDHDATQAFLGVVEEVGELAHALLKHQQGIRNLTPHEFQDAVKDAVGDIMIYLDGFCIEMGISLESTALITWQQVRKRDWQRYPENGIDK